MVVLGSRVEFEVETAVADVDATISLDEGGDGRVTSVWRTVRTTARGMRIVNSGSFIGAFAGGCPEKWVSVLRAIFKMVCASL
jgi:hypothetical protein